LHVYESSELVGIFSVSDLLSHRFIVVFVLFCSSYMHFHSLNSSFGSIVVILVHIARTRYLLRTIRSRLFAIIKGFQHPSIGTRFWQQEIVLENTSVALGLRSSLGEFWRPIILEVLHEPGLGFVHYIIVMGSALFRWVVEAGVGCVGVLTEATVVQVSFVGLILLLFLSIDRASTI
jgi:hypothetical protein